MKGLCLRSLSGELHKVSATAAKDPAATIKDSDKKFGRWQEYIKGMLGRGFAFPQDCYKLPLQAFEGFSFDELCKIYYSTSTMMHRSVDDLFETNAQAEIVRKIESSMWRWSIGAGTWNEVVDAYNCIRNFSFGHRDFELRLDYTTSFNPYGRSKYSRIFIDGVFAYLVYYQRRHVMTIGFSIQGSKHLLIQQVQTKDRSGNRWLYRLPHNRLELVVDLFKKSFPTYSLWVIDGSSLAEKTLEDYRQALQRSERANRADEILEYKNRIDHLSADKPRLAAFYGNVGRFVLGSSKK